MRLQLAPPFFPAGSPCGVELELPRESQFGLLSRTPATPGVSLPFRVLVGECGESRLEGGWLLLEKSAEVQSVVRGLCGQIQCLEGWGRRAGRGGRRAGGVLRGQGRWHTFFGHQDLAEDDGEQEEKEPFGRVRVLGRQLAPDLGGDNKGTGHSGPRRPAIPPSLPPSHPLRRHSPVVGRGPYGSAFGARGRCWCARQGPPLAPGEGQT